MKMILASAMRSGFFVEIDLIFVLHSLKSPQSVQCGAQKIIPSPRPTWWSLCFRLLATCKSLNKKTAQVKDTRAVLNLLKQINTIFLRQYKAKHYAQKKSDKTCEYSVILIFFQCICCLRMKRSILRALQREFFLFLQRPPQPSSNRKR